MATRHVGIDLGGKAIKAGAVSDRGEILARASIPSELDRGPSDLVDRMVALARELGAENALGLGTPGLIDRARGVVTHAPNLKAIEGFPLRSELARKLGIDPTQIHVENDANAAALGEHWLGAARGERDLLLVTLGTGVGGGLILGGELYAGAGGMAGEIGHVVVDPLGPECGCGARGCLETLASASAAERRAAELGLPAEKPGDLGRLAALARERSGPERDLLFAIGRDLGRGLGAAVSLLDLRYFVIGGGFGAALDVLEPGIRAGVRATSYGERLSSLRFVPARLGNDAGWIGAARLSLAARARP
jgi:glucokinase